MQRRRCVGVVVVVVVVVVVGGGVGAVYPTVSINPRREEPWQTGRPHHPLQGNCQERMPWSLGVFRGSDTSESASCRK